jgi:L-rhamnose isomerase
VGRHRVVRHCHEAGDVAGFEKKYGALGGEIAKG